MVVVARWLAYNPYNLHFYGLVSFFSFSIQCTLFLSSLVVIRAKIPAIKAE
jgi:hypothetical protein